MLDLTWSASMNVVKRALEQQVVGRKMLLNTKDPSAYINHQHKSKCLYLV